VLDLDHSQESRELISRFTSSPYFDVQRQLTESQPDSRPHRQRRCNGGLEIDAGFAQKLRKGETAPFR
jgi:ABC-2 type transport system permease protein